MNAAGETTEIRIHRKKLGETVVARRPSPALEDGEIRVVVDRFALTANNVSYAVIGDMFGYWKYYPVDETWGIIPVWGFADVVESRSPAVPVGERIWGFLPMASHAVLKPSSPGESSFVDDSEHRRDLPTVYNTYQRTGLGSPELKAMEDERSLLFPLFTTSFVLHDWLMDNDFFGARQVVITSASSRTGFGLANLLAQDPEHPVRIVGLTSSGNIGFCEGLGSFDTVLPYDRVLDLDAGLPTALVDMSGSASVIASVHEHFGDNLVVSSVVGVTHWQQRGRNKALPGATPTLFFAPAQFMKRDEEWGPGELLKRAFGQSARIAREVAASVSIEHIVGAEACRKALEETIAGTTSPSRGLILSVK